MRVALIGQYPMDPSHIQGGVQAAFSYLVGGLARIPDLELHVIASPGRGPPGRARLARDGGTLHSLPRLPRFEILRNFRTYQRMLDRLLAELKPAVVHVQDAATEAYVALRSGYPTVLTVHGIRRENTKHVGSPLKRLRGLIQSLLLERRNLKRARHLIAISEYVTRSFAGLLAPDVRVYHIPNAIDDAFFDLHDTSDGTRILFAGRVIPRKRVRELVEAFALVVRRVPAAELRIAGEERTDRTYAEGVRSLIAREGLTERVHLLGPLSEEAVLEEFAGAAILALPAGQETAPMVIAQAMAARKPVVATPVGGVGEMVGEGTTGFLVKVDDVEALAEALVRLLRDRELRARMGEAARALAAERYRAESVARRTFEVYRRIAAEAEAVAT